MTVLDESTLKRMGFKSLGRDLRISDRASFYGVENITLGDRTRIDDFCVLSAGDGGITIGRYVHVAVYSSLIGAGAIVLGDYCNISSRVSIYSSSDDYSGASMTNPTVPDLYKNVHHSDVECGKHVIVGSGSVVLPGVTLEEGVAVGALSLIRENCGAFGVYAGTPARRVAERQRGVLDLERKLVEGEACSP